MPYTVAVIGAGAAGLAAVKCCLDEGLEPVCFERRDYVGGLWHYSSEVGDGRANIIRSTVTNLSKEFSAYSDFPPPKEYPPYPQHWLYDDYLNLYADKFGIRSFIRLKTEVVSLEEASDHVATGNWVITVRQLEDGQKDKLTVNAVLLCTGAFSQPYIPTVEGRDSFKGRVIHSYEYTENAGYANKRVVVVGLGNTALDIATDLSHVTKQVYISYRSGSWLFTRLGMGGLPSDMNSSRFANFKQTYFPNYVNRDLQQYLNDRLDHERYGLCPGDKPTRCNIIVSEELPGCLISGSIKMAKGIARLDGTTVEFSVGRCAEDVDVVIYATGYRPTFPFLDKRIFGKDVRDLYKATIPPDRKHPTLAVIGCYRLLGGPVPPCAEMQCRLATRVFKGLVHLPSEEIMQREIYQRKRKAFSQHVENRCYIIQLPYLPYMIDLAEMIGCNPSIGWLLLTDPRLALQCLFGACTPYQFRLRGPGAWEGAREALLTQLYRTYYSLDHGTGRMTKKKKRGLRKIFWLSVVVWTLFSVYKDRHSILAFIQDYLA